jgi:hypothetical protein
MVDAHTHDFPHRMTCTRFALYGVIVLTKD